MKNDLLCDNKTGCNGQIDTSQHYVVLEERTFCCTECVMEYIEQERRLEYTRETFKPENSEPLNYKRSREI